MRETLSNAGRVKQGKCNRFNYRKTVREFKDSKVFK